MSLSSGHNLFPVPSRTRKLVCCSKYCGPPPRVSTCASFRQRGNRSLCLHENNLISASKWPSAEVPPHPVQLPFRPSAFSMISGQLLLEMSRSSLAKKIFFVRTAGLLQRWRQHGTLEAVTELWLYRASDSNVAANSTVTHKSSDTSTDLSRNCKESKVPGGARGPSPQATWAGHLPAKNRKAAQTWSRNTKS